MILWMIWKYNAYNEIERYIGSYRIIVFLMQGSHQKIWLQYHQHHVEFSMSLQNGMDSRYTIKYDEAIQ